MRIMEQQYAPAENIIQLVNNLMVEALNQEQAHFYVPIYEDTLALIRDTLLYENLSNQTIYIMGQKGSGKTTALNFLPNEELEEKFTVLKLYANDLFEIHDVDIADVLMMLCHQLTKDNARLEKKFRNKLERIQGFLEGSRTEEEVRKNETKIEGGIGGAAKMSISPIAKFLGLWDVGVNLFANLRVNKDARQIVREVFNTTPREIFDLTNTIIEEYQIEHGNKEILLIINELDHARNAEKVFDLFVDNRYYLEQLKCRKVISVPLVLDNEGEFAQGAGRTIEYMGLKMSENPLLKTQTQETLATIDKNKNCLRQIVKKRIASNADLISEEALEEALQFSGGVLRQFINILIGAGRRARRFKATQLTLSDIQEGIRAVRQDMEGPLKGKDIIALLDEVRLHHTATPEDRNLLIKAFLSNQILAYRNDPTWYSINPLIEETIEIYAQSLEKDDE